MDGDGGPKIVPAVPGDDSVRAGQPGGLVCHGILKVPKAKCQGIFENWSAHRRHLKEREQHPDMLPCFRGADRLLRQVVDVRDSRGAQATGDFASFHAGQQFRGGQRVWPTIEQQVENHVGIEEKFHRYFFSRCFR